MMLKFLFWNTKRRPLENLVADLCRTHEIDLLLLVENTAPPARMLLSLNKKSADYRYHHSPSEKTKLYSRLPRNSVINMRDTLDSSFRRVQLLVGNDLLLVAVHLPSKLYMAPADQSQICTRIARHVREEELKAGHMRTIVVGDFNMNPFEDGLVSSEGFHAVMTRALAAKGARSVRQDDRPFFYNPMWNRFGESLTRGLYGHRPAGTYYYADSKPVSLFWHVFDQVLIRPDLLNCFDDQSLHIVTSAGDTSLLKADQTPNSRAASDHLPIVFTLNNVGRD
jgi:Endonuclease/Exonuclease/phosphatase family.